MRYIFICLIVIATIASSSAQTREQVTMAVQNSPADCGELQQEYERVCFGIDIEGDAAGPPLEYIWSKDKDTIRGKEAAFCIVRAKNEKVCLSSYDAALGYTSVNDTCFDLFLDDKQDLSFTIDGNVQVNNTLRFTSNQAKKEGETLAWDIGTEKLIVGDTLKHVYYADGVRQIKLYRLKGEGAEASVVDCVHQDINVLPYRRYKQ